MVTNKKSASEQGKASREKGKRGERAFCQFCKSEGYGNVHRTAQFRGNTGAAGDVEGLPGIHVEVKNVEKLNVRAALEQSIRDAEASGKGEIPILAHKKNNAEWLITMRAEDWFQLYREWEDWTWIDT